MQMKSTEAKVIFKLMAPEEMEADLVTGKSN